MAGPIAVPAVVLIVVLAAVLVAVLAGVQNGEATAVPMAGWLPASRGLRNGSIDPTHGRGGGRTTPAGCWRTSSTSHRLEELLGSS